MSGSPRGCLLFAVPARVLGVGRPALSAARSLPVLDTQRIHRADLPTLVRARVAAERCFGVLKRQGHRVAEPMRSEIEVHLIGLVGGIYAMGLSLGEGRRFLDAHSAERLARERTDLELELVGASAERLVELKQVAAALERRASSVGRLEDQVATLSSRLEGAVAGLQEIEARQMEWLGTETLVHTLRAWEQSATLSLDALAATMAELER